jgi:hypothetical protein
MWSKLVFQHNLGKWLILLYARAPPPFSMEEWIFWHEKVNWRYFECTSTNTETHAPLPHGLTHQRTAGANPTIVIYNASFVHKYLQHHE